MYHDKAKKDSNYISINDLLNKFPKCVDAWNNGDDENYKGKYKHLYLGFGNGLNIDNSIFNEYKLYLDEAIQNKIKQENYTKEEKEKYKYSTIYNVWEIALIKMAENKNIIIK